MEINYDSLLKNIFENDVLINLAKFLEDKNKTIYNIRLFIIKYTNIKNNIINKTLLELMIEKNIQYERCTKCIKNNFNIPSDKLCLCPYINKITPILQNQISKTREKYIHNPTIFNIISCDELITSHKVRQLQMLEGIIFELFTGYFYQCKRLHPTKNNVHGLDIIKFNNNREYYFELKNKYNTMNSNSRKTILDKLAQYKKTNPNGKAILGILNPKPNQQFIRKTIIHNNEKILELYGNELLNMIFTFDNFNYNIDNQIVNYIKNLLE